jgi:hypothetical protein
MAASSALPPARNAATPDCEASRWGDATMPRGARDSGQRVIITDADGYDATAETGTAARLPRTSGSSRMASTIAVASTAQAPAV